MMNSFLRHTFLAAATALVAQAAPIELTASTEGDGIVFLGGADAPVSKANLVLKRDGKFALGLVGRDTFQFSGTWQDAGRGVKLFINNAMGKDAAATGTVDLAATRRGSYEVIRFSASGSAGRNALRIRFTVQAPDPRPPIPEAPTTLVNSTRAGRGVFDVAGDRPQRLSYAYVRLFDTGRAFVNVYGAVNLGYVGTWRPVGNGTTRLEVRGGIANERISGVLNIEGKTFTNLTLSGEISGRYYKVEFDAR